MRWSSAVVASVLVGCGEPPPEPDGRWEVTVTGCYDGSEVCAGVDTTDCVDPESTANFQETYTYELFFDGSDTTLKIDGATFGNGTISLCTLAYHTPVWSETRDDGAEVQWYVSGDAVIPSLGNCEVDGDYDWVGLEVLEVAASEDPAIVEGCQYPMEVVGVNVGTDDD